MRKSKLQRGIYFSKEKDGRYKIVTISTAALKDREDETFSISAMDYDIKVAKETGIYPEYRVFHSKALGFGLVEKMKRVGIFMVDEGHSYNDPFSIEICEKMLLNNDEGKWRVSRGFAVHELQGHCYKCGSSLSVQKEHFLIGFRCPGCDSVHLRYKGALDDVVFRKVKTFDVSVTDVPAVMQTSAMAYPAMEDYMTKKDLEKRLLQAGISKEVIKERMKDIDEDALKEYESVPDAILLKELEIDGPDEDEDEEEDVEETEDGVEEEADEAVSVETDTGVVEVDASIVKAIKEVVRSALRTELEGLEINLETTAEKEYGDQLNVLKEEISDLKKLLKAYLKSDTVAVKELLTDTPRKTKARVLRFKALDTAMEDDEEDVEDEDEEDEDEEEKVGKNYKAMIPSLNRNPRVLKGNGTAIVDGAGNTYGSLSQMVGRNDL